MIFTFTWISCDGNDHKANTCGDGEISSADAVWSHGEGDLQNSKRAPGIRQKGCFTGPQTTPQIQWSFDLGGPGTDAAPVIGNDGTIYLIGEYPGQAKGGGVRNAGLFAISPDGNMKWFLSRPRESALIYKHSVTSATDGTLFLRMWDSSFYALNSSGEVKWSKRMTLSSDPVVDNNGFVYVGTDTIYSFEQDGTIRWKYINESPISYCQRIVLGRNGIYCGFYQNGILALDYTGHKKWFYPVTFDNSYHYGVLVDEADNIYFKTNSNEIQSIDRNGNFRWGGSVGVVGGMSEPVLRGDYLYFGSFLQVYRLDKKTGTELTLLGSVPNGSYISSDVSPVIDDNGVVYIGSGAGGISAISSEGQKLWQMLIPNANFYFEGYMAMSPDGTLYIASWESSTPGVINKLYAIR